tara:strand:+ start:360 stop:524 length:165 start_codon:yes stop_codon:yes gene_type:complete
MATKIPVAQARLFANRFVCKKCGHKMRTQATRILSGKIRCRKCNSNALRSIRRK